MHRAIRSFLIVIALTGNSARMPSVAWAADTAAILPDSASELADPGLIAYPDGHVEIWGTADYYIKAKSLEELRRGMFEVRFLEFRRADGTRTDRVLWDLFPLNLPMADQRGPFVIGGGMSIDDFATGNPGRRLRVAILKERSPAKDIYEILEIPVIGTDSSGWFHHMYGHIIRVDGNGDLWIIHEKVFPGQGQMKTEIWKTKLSVLHDLSAKVNPLRGDERTSRKVVPSGNGPETLRSGGQGYLVEGYREISGFPVPAETSGSRDETIGFVAAKDFQTDNYPLYVVEPDLGPKAQAEMKFVRDEKGHYLDLGGLIRKEVFKETGMHLSWGPSRGDPHALPSLHLGRSRLLLLFHGFNTNLAKKAGIPVDPEVGPAWDITRFFKRGVYLIEVEVWRDKAGRLRFALVPNTFSTILPSRLDSRSIRELVPQVRCLEKKLNEMSEAI